MASPPPSSSAKGTRWGSFLSQAVAGVEARLDTILAESDEAAKDAAKDVPAKLAAATSQPVKAASTPRSGSANRANDRLQEKLARAVAAKSGAASPGLGSFTTSTPASASPRQSIDVPSRASMDSAGTGVKDSLSGIDLTAVWQSTEASKRPSFESTAAETDEDGKKLRTAEKGAAADGISAETGGASIAAAAEAQSAPAGETTAPSGQAEPPAVSGLSTAALDAVRDARIKQLEEELEEDRRQHQDDIHHHIEKQEALQSKVQYLSREASEAAKKAIQSAEPGSLEKKLAEKDQLIVQLLEEGRNLGVTEQKHRTILKKLRAKISEHEKEIADLTAARSRADAEVQTQRARARHASELERSLDEAHKRTRELQKETESLRSDAVSKTAAIADLKQQLKAAQDHAEAIKVRINDAALEKERQRAKELEEQLATLQLEKSLVADRAKAQINEWKEKAERATERAHMVEVESKAEAQMMESKLEAMRVRAEEAASGAVGDSQAKLMRQVETLQSQYAIASGNWQGIESTLLARVSSLEKERDEALQRESEMRKKAREAALRAKRTEEDLEEARFKLPKVQQDVGAFEEQIEALKKRAEAAESARDKIKSEFEEQKAAWKEEKQQQQHQQQQQERERRLDANDRGNWLESLPNLPGLPLSPLPPQIGRGGSNSRPETPLLQSGSQTWSSELLGIQSLSTKLRKPSAVSSQDDPLSRFPLRRPSGQPPTRPPPLLSSSGSNTNIAGLPLVFSPTSVTEGGGGAGSLSSSHHNNSNHISNYHQHPAQLPQRQSSVTTPVEIQDDRLDGIERPASPTQSQALSQQQGLVQDMVSVSTVGAGPSVQLVERMSAAIRRLESEKVAAREELARLSKQRNEARTEVLALLKDVEAGRAATARVGALEAEVAELQARYDTTLELLGEKSELVEELRADVDDVKAMYRDLIERTIE